MPKKFDSEYQPTRRRTRDKLTLVLESIREANLLDLDETSSRETAEKAVFKFLAKAAFMPSVEEAQLSNTALNLLIKKAWPDNKPTAEKVEFDYDKSSSPSDNANAVLDAVSKGDLAPDIGQMLIGMIKDTLQIVESTELIKRLEEIEKSLSARS